MRQGSSILNELKTLIRVGGVSTQEEICHRLQQMGFDVNQTKVSRLLRKIGAVKTKNEDGVVVYHLPKEPPPPTPDSTLGDLVIDIAANETCLIVHTSPGSASLIGRMLDYHRKQAGILGTLAGDDTVLVIPESIANIDNVGVSIQQLLETR